jgi:hypothetical protein
VHEPIEGIELFKTPGQPDPLVRAGCGSAAGDPTGRR